MLPSETMIWQPEFTDKTLSRKPGAVQNQWGALCYYSVDGQAEADIMPRKKPFVPSVSEIKTLMTFVKY
jgi:hypothetical protein